MIILVNTHRIFVLLVEVSGVEPLSEKLLFKRNYNDVEIVALIIFYARLKFKKHHQQR